MRNPQDFRSYNSEITRESVIFRRKELKPHRSISNTERPKTASKSLATRDCGGIRTKINEAQQLSATILTSVALTILFPLSAVSQSASAASPKFSIAVAFDVSPYLRSLPQTPPITAVFFQRRAGARSTTRRWSNRHEQRLLRIRGSAIRSLPRKAAFLRGRDIFIFATDSHACDISIGRRPYRLSTAIGSDVLRGAVAKLTLKRLHQMVTARYLLRSTSDANS
jgi:hypothetical protein